MKRFLLSVALLLACSGVAFAQESEFSGGGGGGSVSSVGSGFGMNFSTITSSGSVALNAGVSAYAQGAL
jgi:hypothetical protein